MARISCFSYMGNLSSFGLVEQGFRRGAHMGGNLGAMYGVLSASTYNPNILDKRTGELRKMNPLERGGLLVGSGIAGGAVGTLGGSLIGGSLGASQKYLYKGTDALGNYYKNMTN